VSEGASDLHEDRRTKKGRRTADTTGTSRVRGTHDDGAKVFGHENEHHIGRAILKSRPLSSKCAFW